MSFINFFTLITLDKLSNIKKSLALIEKIALENDACLYVDNIGQVIYQLFIHNLVNISFTLKVVILS